MDWLREIPVWYWVIAFVWSTYQGFRGPIEHRANGNGSKWKWWQRFVIIDLHDFVFRSVCTLAGFIALYLAYRLAGDLNSLQNLSTPVAALAAFLYLIAIIGIGGQLHYVILFKKLPASG